MITDFTEYCPNCGCIFKLEKGMGSVKWHPQHCMCAECLADEAWEIDHRSIHEGPHLVLEALDTTGKNGKTIQIVSEHPVIVPYVSQVKANYLRLAVPVKELHLQRTSV